MPYDNPRPEEPVKRGPVAISAPISRIAPKGAFRMIATDTRSGKEWLEDDLPMTKQKAFDEARNRIRGQRNLKFVLYDDKGQYVDTISESS